MPPRNKNIDLKKTKGSLPRTCVERKGTNYKDQKILKQQIKELEEEFNNYPELKERLKRRLGARKFV